MKNKTHSDRITMTRENLCDWPSFQKLYDEDKILFDKSGRLRYPHGTPVGDMVLVRIDNNGKAIYKESAEEWFGPESPAVAKFVWPK